MDDDGGVQWWQTVGQQEEMEMSEVKHTPGPWKWEENSVSSSAHTCIEVRQDLGKTEYSGQIAYMQSAEHVGLMPRGEVMANASLIAAAPDLLESLQELVEIVQSAIDNKSSQYLDSFTLQPARAAIAKSTGRQ
jgi:hypothetical protein